jgi:hypothetical protein
MFSYSTGYYVSPPVDQYLKFKNRCSLVYTPRLCCGGRTDSPGGEGDGGSIFWKTREIGLPSCSKICNLCLGLRRWMSFCPLILSPSISFSVVLQDGGKKRKRKKNINHHGQRTIPNICHLPDADSPSHVYSYRRAQYYSLCVLKIMQLYLLQYVKQPQIQKYCSV